MKTVYLAGPIAGLCFDRAQDWRKLVIDSLHDSGIKGLSPLRGKEYLRAAGVLSGTGEEYAHLGPMSLPRGVMTRDHFDATRCDVLFVNLLGAASVSIGTCMEIAWAFAIKTPIVCAIENEGNPHEHMMVREAVGFRCATLEEAVHITKAILA